MTDKQATKELNIEILAQRVLQNPQSASSETVFELLNDCIDKAQALERQMVSEAAKATDPLTADGGRAARTASEDARLDAARARKLELMLRDLLAVVLDRELRDKWNSDHARVGVVVEQADQRFRKLPGLLEEVGSILAECERADALSSEQAARAPSGEARGFTLFRDRQRALFDRTVLVDFAGQQVWPVKHQIDIDAIVPKLGFDPRYSSRWWESDSQRRQQQAEREQEELAAATVARDQFYGKRS